MDVNDIRREMVGAIVTIGAARDLGRNHPSVRVLAESVMGLLSDATNEALDAHAEACQCCAGRVVAMLGIFEQGYRLAADVSAELMVPITPGQVLLAGCQ